LLIIEAMMSNSLFDYQESAFDPISLDAVPHYARLADGDYVLKIHNLAGGQRRISVLSAEAALAVIEQTSGHFLMGRIVEGKSKMAIGGMTALGTALGSGHDGFWRSVLVRMHRSAALPPFRIISAFG
jgi:hypothetical protein